MKIKRNTRAGKFWENLGDSNLKNWKLFRVGFGLKGRCICGQPIKHLFFIRNLRTGVEKILGSCCVRRLGIRMRWRSKADYLANAYLLARNDWERRFVMSVQDKLPKYGGRLIISRKQKAILERITNRRWRWKTWEDDDFYNFGEVTHENN